MKHSKCILILALLFMAINTCIAQSQDITSNFSKKFYITYFCADLDTDGSFDNNDMGKLAEKNHYLSLDYHDMGSSGNTMAIQFSDCITKYFTDVIFKKSQDDECTIYFVYDAQGDLILRVIFDEELKKWLLFVSNISILEKYT